MRTTWYSWASIAATRVYNWSIPLEKGESLTQIFTASGNSDGVAIERQADKAKVTVPGCDGVVLLLRRGE